MTSEVKTPERSEYIFTQAPDEIFKFKLRAPREAQIALTSKPIEDDPIIEIFIGSSENQKSFIRKNFEDPEILVEVDTPDILHPRKMLGFWIRWQENIITVGREKEDDGFMTCTISEDEEMFPIYFIGIRVGDDAHGTWLLETARKCSGPGFWVPASGGVVPQFGIHAGEENGEKLYIARAPHAGDVLPGKLVPSKGVCFVSYDGAEYSYVNYEVFCGSGGHWEPSSDGEVPANAVRGGKTEYGETLYLGRVEHEVDGLLMKSLGKVHPSHECLYIPYGGVELSFKDYEVFVWEPYGIMEFIR